ncbi:unnamed protein product, partial [Effrenium voratum]
LDLLRPGPPLLLQSPARMGSALPPSGCACTGSSLILLDCVSPGVPLAIRGALKQSGEISLGQDLNVNGYGSFGNWPSAFRVMPILHRQCQRGQLQGLSLRCLFLTSRTLSSRRHCMAAAVWTRPLQPAERPSLERGCRSWTLRVSAHPFCRMVIQG